MTFFPDTAIILAAGMGARMRPFTDSAPKCMASVGGVSIIENALSVMGRAGVKRALIVCGYKADVLTRHCGNIKTGPAVEFLLNPEYERTNSMYSLKLALDAVKSPCWALEGDVFFKDDILRGGFNREDGFVWLGDSSYRSSGGSFLKTGAGGVLTEVSILSTPLEISHGALKSAGILGLGSEAVNALSGWLDAGVAQDKADRYYDLIISEHLGERPVTVRDVSPSKWMEIDTMSELEEAEKLFRQTE